MKKILLVLTLLMTMVIGANAQSDGFFIGGDNYDGSGRTTAMPMLPSGSVGSIKGDQPAPLGSGLLIISVLGGAYLLRKKKLKKL